MTKVKSISDIAALYEAVRAPKQEIVEEKSAKFPKGTFPQSSKEVEATKEFESSGPNKALNATGQKKKAKAKKSLKKNKKSGKVVEDSINSFMKSEFDKLFENVMGDDESSFEVTPSMGPEGSEGDSPEMDLGGDEEMGGDDVTITLSKDLAQQLHDVLMGVLEGETEGEDQELEDLGIDMEAEGEPSPEGESLNDATEMSELKDSAGAGLMGKSNKAPGNVTNKAGGKASHTTATDKQGNETKGHPLDKDERLDHKVEGQTVTNKTGKPLFQ